MEQCVPVLSPEYFRLSVAAKATLFPSEDATPLFDRDEYESLLLAHDEARIREMTRDDGRVCSDDRIVTRFGGIC